MNFHRGLTLLVLLCLLGCSSGEGSEYQMVCVCRCCYLGDCKPAQSNGTFPTDSCSACTKDRCSSRLGGRNATLGQECDGDKTFLKAECYNRNAFFPKLTCFVLIGLLMGLIIFGVAKNQVPALAAYSAKHFDY
eukprot:TRINITY_DN10124_c0_g1_i1.p1 TRINITY_DN10124_c0_g1~~TRINITY_DN10124_c0_g1_i1.p1  ORF type:complete len:134 (+),score=10.22 TRINITY_DN10124_c0_g1_i1:47-448(+)